MPPKAPPKKGTTEEIDLSEISSLPEANTTLIQIIYEKFKTTQSRTKLQDHLSQPNVLPDQRVKTVTRQEIIDYGKSKGICEDAVTAENGNKTTAGLNYKQMLAQAAADKLYEVKLQARKVLREKQLKKEEELKTADPTEPAKKVETDKDIINLIINIPDYPMNAGEAIEFSRYGQQINCIFQIYQVQEDKEGKAPIDLKLAKEVNPNADELAHFEKQKKRIQDIKEAISVCAKNAPLRHTAFFRVPFCDVEQVDFKENEEGEQTTNTRTSQQAFGKFLYEDWIEKMSAFWLNYKKFKDRVEIVTLMPDKQVMSELRELKRAHEDFLFWKEEREATKKEIVSQQLTDNQKELLTPQELSEFEMNRNSSVISIEGELEIQTQLDKKNQERIKELIKLASRSIDEERNKSFHFQDSIYKKDFIPNKEIQNNISSIMSAMVSQIAVENHQAQSSRRLQFNSQSLGKLSNENLSMNESKIDLSTDAETNIEDLFEAFKQEIAYDTNLEEREPADEDFEQQNLKGILPNEFNVYETYDTSTKPLQSLPVGLIEEKKAHAYKIAQREKISASYFKVPGCNRFQMPENPQKSKRLRDYENPQFYPFSTLPIEDAERTLQLRALQQLIKSTNIDEGAKPKDRATRCKMFERKYEEHFEPDVFKQVYQEAIRNDPDIITQYYPRQDQLFVVLYNKINGSKRTSDNKEKPHGIKKWNAPQRVFPDFQQWVEIFGNSVNVKNPQYYQKDQAEPPYKYQIDGEQIPKNLIDIDNSRIQSIKRNLIQYFPDDNSIMTVEEWEVGGVQRSKNIIYKDGFTFGFSQVEEDNEIKQEKEIGLVSYKTVGKQQLWLKFQDKESRLLVETVEVRRNQRKLIEVAPPPPTAEEIAAKEEAAKQAAAAAAKGGKKPGAPAVVEQTFPEEKKAEPKFIEAPPTFLDNIFADSELGEATTGACSTITMQTGLMVRHLPNGDIIQIKDPELLIEEKNQKLSPNYQLQRMHVQGGVVICFLKSKDVEVLYPTGEYAYFNKKERKWVLTNQKGFRREFKDGKQRDLPQINCLSQTDATTGVVTRLRADNVVTIEYQDGNRYCQHADGTQILIQDDGECTRVEKEGFAPVVYTQTEECDDIDDWLNVEELKSLDGILTTVLLPDGCQVKTLKFFKNSDETEHQVFKHLYLRSDFSCFMIDNEGEFKVISTNTRAAINDEDERTRLGNDTDFLKQMYQPQHIINPGVYYGQITADIKANYSQIRDSEKTYLYRLTGLNKLEKKTYTNFQENEDWKQSKNSKDQENELEIEPIGVHKNPYTRNFIFPRVFIVNPNGQGIELLNQDQVDQLIKNQGSKTETLTASRIEYVDKTQLNSIQVISKVGTLEEQQIINQKIEKLEFPEYSWPYIIPRKSEEEKNKLKPLQDQYVFRNISEFNSFDPIKQNSFNEDYNRFLEWKQQQLRQDTEFGIHSQVAKDSLIDQDEIEEQEFYARRINNKIYTERNLQRKPFPREKFKQNFQHAFNKDHQIVSFRKKNTSVEKEEKEIMLAQKKKEEAFNQRALEADKAQKEDQLEKWRDKKRRNTRKHVDERLRQFNEMKQTLTFTSHYHLSSAGQNYLKVNPVKPPSEEVLMRMSQRINRNQIAQNSHQKPAQNIFDGSVQKNSLINDKENSAEKENPIVALEPENQQHHRSIDRSKKASKMQGSATKGSQDPAEIGPSLYQQEKDYLKQVQQEKTLRAEEHHVIKTKDFDVFGKLRQEKPLVKVIQKSQVPSELNEKFITTESITDRRVKISSMANRQYVNAPSIEEVRKQGQHQMILQAINKKQTFSELINQANSMVTSVLHDSMKRSVNILPSNCAFGIIRVGECVELVITIKNEDSLSQRILIKPFEDPRLSAKQESYGAIAPGITRKVFIILDSKIDGSSKIKENLQIVTKTDVFKIPVTAEILSTADIQKAEVENKRIGNSRVRARLSSALEQTKKNNDHESEEAQALIEKYKQSKEQAAQMRETKRSEMAKTKMTGKQNSASSDDEKK